MTTRTNPEPNWVTRHQLAAFFGLSFALAWWVWPFTAVNPDSVAMLPASPIIAAVVVTAVSRQPHAVRTLLAPLVRWRVAPTWYAVAFFGPLLFIGTTAALAAGTIGRSAPTPGVSDWVGLPLVFLTTLLVKGPLFEEVGWRGFALPRMQRRWTPVASALMLGVVWGVWHLPLLISDPAAQRPPVQYLLWMIAASVLVSWLYNRTDGNVLLVTIFHAAMNSWASFILPMFAGDRYVTMWWLLVGTTSTLAAIIIWRTKGTLGVTEARQGMAAGLRPEVSQPARRSATV